MGGVPGPGTGIDVNDLQPKPPNHVSPSHVGVVGVASWLKHLLSAICLISGAGADQMRVRGRSGGMLLLGSRWHLTGSLLVMTLQVQCVPKWAEPGRGRPWPPSSGHSEGAGSSPGSH